MAGCWDCPGPWQLYARGGFAFYNGKADQTTTKPGYFTTGTSTFTGWVAGAGLERNMGGNMSADLEYDHFDFGSRGGSQTSTGDPPIGYVYEDTTRLTADAIKIGVDWKLN